MIRCARAGSSFAEHWIADADVVCNHPRAGRLDRYTRLAVSAAQALLAGAPAVANPVDLGVFLASEWGSFAANADHWAVVSSGGVASPLIFPATVPSAAAGEVAMLLGAMGPNVTLVGGAEALVPIARASLAAGDCGAAIVGVVDAWHPRMAALGLDWHTHDGACLALFTAASAWNVPFRPAPSALLAFSLALQAQ